MLSTQPSLRVTVHPVRVDLATPNGFAAFHDPVLEGGRRLEVVASNAGVRKGGGFVDNDPDDELAIVDLKIPSTLRLANQVPPAMIQQGGGRVLVTSRVTTCARSEPPSIATGPARTNRCGLNAATRRAVDSWRCRIQSGGAPSLSYKGDYDGSAASRQGQPVRPSRWGVVRAVPRFASELVGSSCPGARPSFGRVPSVSRVGPVTQILVSTRGCHRRDRI